MGVTVAGPIADCGCNAMALTPAKAMVLAMITAAADSVASQRGRCRRSKEVQRITGRAPFAWR
jgi:hypothetical protein